MDTGQAVDLVRHSLIIALTVSAPMLLIGLVVGRVFALNGVVPAWYTPVQLGVPLLLGLGLLVYTLVFQRRPEYHAPIATVELAGSAWPRWCASAVPPRPSRPTATTPSSRARRSS